MTRGRPDREQPRRPPLALVLLRFVSAGLVGCGSASITGRVVSQLGDPLPWVWVTVEYKPEVDPCSTFTMAEVQEDPLPPERWDGAGFVPDDSLQHPALRPGVKIWKKQVCDESFRPKSSQVATDHEGRFVFDGVVDRRSRKKEALGEHNYTLHFFKLKYQEKLLEVRAKSRATVDLGDVVLLDVRLEE